MKQYELMYLCKLSWCTSGHFQCLISSGTDFCMKKSNYSSHFTTGGNNDFRRHCRFYSSTSRLLLRTITSVKVLWSAKYTRTRQDDHILCILWTRQDDHMCILCVLHFQVPSRISTNSPSFLFFYITSVLSQRINRWRFTNKYLFGRVNI